MHWFYQNPLPLEDSVHLEKTDLKQHLSARRIRTGEQITLFNGRGQTQIRQKREDGLYRLETRSFTPLTKKFKLIAWLPLLDNNRMRALVADMTELGVDAICFFHSERQDGNIKNLKNKKKKTNNFYKDKLLAKEKLAAILQAASSQCQRPWLPKVFSHPINLEQIQTALLKPELPKKKRHLVVALARASQFNHTSKVAHRASQSDEFKQFKLNGHRSISDGRNHLHLLAGPPGGFSESELKKWHEVFEQNQNSGGLCLSNYVLRSETALVALLAAINNRID